MTERVGAEVNAFLMVFNPSESEERSWEVAEGELGKNRKMTNKESIERNIGLTFDYVNYLMDHPAEVDKLPASFKVEFIEKDFPTIEKNEPAKQTPRVKRKYVRVRNTFEMTP